LLRSKAGFDNFLGKNFPSVDGVFTNHYYRYVKKNYPQITLIGIFILVIFLLLITLFSNGMISRFLQKKYSNKNNLNFEQIKLQDLTIYQIPVAFLSTPHELSSFKAEAALLGDLNVNKINVYLGVAGGNMKGGSCEFDAQKKKFTGNAQWRLQSTEELVNTVSNNKKGLLRFYFPQNAISPEEIQGNEQKMTYITGLVNELNTTGTLSKEYVLYPDELCISQ
jgi:hypothetical protein